MHLSPYMGILCAVFALFAWGFADFFIQKSSRIIGVWKVMFSVGMVGFLLLFPFVKNDILLLETKDVLLMALLGVVILGAMLFNFLALKKGKIAIVEPLLGMELPITVALSISVGKEHLNLVEFALVAIIFAGILMVITAHHKHLHQTRRTIEKGVMLAIAASIGLALTNMLVGVTSRQISPLMVIWFAQTEVLIMATIYLISTKQMHVVLKDLKSHFKSTLGQSLLYNSGWIAFALATTAIATSIVTAVSESYIILGIVLGIFVNHERLRPHQVFGVFMASGGIVALSVFSG